MIVDNVEISKLNNLQLAWLRINHGFAKDKWQQANNLPIINPIKIERLSGLFSSPVI